MSSILQGWGGAELCVHSPSTAEEVEYVYPAHLTLFLPLVLLDVSPFPEQSDCESCVGGSLGAWTPGVEQGREEVHGLGQ